MRTKAHAQQRMRTHTLRMLTELGVCSAGCRRRQWHPTLVLLPGKSHGWRSLVGYTVHGVAKSQTRLSNFTFISHPPETLQFQDSTSMAGKPQPALLLLSHFSRARLCATP